MYLKSLFFALGSLFAEQDLIFGEFEYVEYKESNPISRENALREEERKKEFLDLEEEIDSFVLETKKIVIPEFPDAFNPSFVKWKGSVLMSFRIYNKQHTVAPQIGLIWLDSQFSPIGKPQMLEFLEEDFKGGKKRQDPRLFTIGEDLYVAYNNVQEGTTELRRMYFAKVQFDGNRFFVDCAERIGDFEQQIPSRSEKNWVPFVYEEELFFAYSLEPHKIFRPILGTGACETFATSSVKTGWKHGVLRGGTPAIKINEEEYLAFFHSSINLSSVHSKGKLMLHYFMGAYTFSAQPPFELRKISPKPIIGKNFYHGPLYKTWKPLCCVFPTGIIEDDAFIWISYGRQDHESWVAKIDKKGLLESLCEL